MIAITVKQIEDGNRSKARNGLASKLTLEVAGSRYPTDFWECSMHVVSVWFDLVLIFSWTKA